MAYTDWLVSLQKQIASLLFGKDADGNVIGIAHAEDVAHVSGDVGFLGLGVRKDTAAALAGTDGDYVPLIMDANGRLHVALSALQLDDTDKLAVSLYGKRTAAGDTAIVSDSFGRLLTCLGGVATALVDALSNTSRTPRDDEGNQVMNVAFGHLFNGTTWDRQRGNTEGTLLASAARTATTNSTDQVNYNARGVMVYFSITAVPGTDTVTLTVTGKDPIAGTYEVLLTGAAEVGTATRCYLVYPGAGTAANGVDVVNAFPLPRTWRVTVTHSGSGSFTYSVGYALIL